MKDSTQTIQIRHGDSFEILKGFDEGSVGAIVCDPPYGLSFMGKEWDDLDDNHHMQIWHEGWLRECYRVLKPGGVIKAFSGTRTFHRLAAAMENVGFILDPKDSLTAWVYASGFPKSLNIGKAIDKMQGAEREVIGEVRRWGANASGGRGGQNANGFQESIKGAERMDPVTAPATEDAKRFDGYGTALKPAWEPFIVGRKPE